MADDFSADYCIKQCYTLTIHFGGIQTVVLLLLPQTKPISYKLFPYLLCHSQVPRKTAGKQSVNFKQPTSVEQCIIPRRKNLLFWVCPRSWSKKEGGTLKVKWDELFNFKYAAGMLPMISKELRFQYSQMPNWSALLGTPYYQKPVCLPGGYM